MHVIFYYSPSINLMGTNFDTIILKKFCEDDIITRLCNKVDHDNDDDAFFQ
jgi:hypothetical protein